MKEDKAEREGKRVDQECFFHPVAARKGCLGGGVGAASSKVPRPGGTGPVQGTYLKPVRLREAGQGPWGEEVVHGPHPGRVPCMPVVPASS